MESYLFPRFHSRAPKVDPSKFFFAETELRGNSQESHQIWRCRLFSDFEKQSSCNRANLAKHRHNMHENSFSFESGRGGEIRTHDPLYPKQVRYQTAPRPDRGGVLQRVAGHGNHLEREDAKSFKDCGPLFMKDRGPTVHSRVRFDIPGLPPIRSPPGSQPCWISQEPKVTHRIALG